MWCLVPLVRPGIAEEEQVPENKNVEDDLRVPWKLDKECLIKKEEPTPKCFSQSKTWAEEAPEWHNMPTIQCT
jgi:hypothetical protein